MIVSTESLEIMGFQFEIKKIKRGNWLQIIVTCNHPQNFKDPIDNFYSENLEKGEKRAYKEILEYLRQQ